MAITMVCCLLLLAPPLAATDEQSPPPPSVSFLHGTAYLEQLLSDIEQAEEEIAVMMFACVLPVGPRPSHSVRRILDALHAAQQRGVRVRVLLDAERYSDGSEDSVNNEAADYLLQAGVPIHRDEDDRRTHTKTVLIDQRIIFVGSANWTWSAFHRNREHTLRVIDPVSAGQAKEAFSEAWELSRPHRR